MKRRKTKIDTADLPTMEKPGKRGCALHRHAMRRLEKDGRRDWDSVEMDSPVDH